MNRAETYARAMVARAVTPPPVEPVTVEQMLTALAELGATADEVADRLRALGIRGTRGHICQCPIAVYIRTRLGVRPAVSREFVEWAAWPTWQQVATPPVVRAFLRHYDRGVYLDLVGAETVG